MTNSTNPEISSANPETASKASARADQTLSRLESLLQAEGLSPVEVQPKSTECRGHIRHPVDRRQLLAIPVLPDGSPNWQLRTTGNILDASATGLGIELDISDTLHSTQWILGVDDQSGRLQYAGTEVRYSDRLASGRVRAGCLIGGLSDKVLCLENLTPRVQFDTMEFKFPLADTVLNRWAEIGVLEATVCDRVQLCPQCFGLPTFRTGCRNCGSARIANDQLIHHFACAHVGFVHDFESPQGLVCPKCRTRNLVVSADYEYMNGPYRCLDCHWSDAELEHVGQCLRCGLRFPGYQAHEQELRGYRAARLDPLALVPTR